MKKLVSLLGFIACTSTFATPTVSSVWQDVQEIGQRQQRGFNALNADQTNHKERLKRRSLSLDESRLKSILIDSGSITNQAIEINLPLPQGGFARVAVTNSPILSPELAERYPHIKTWRIKGVDDPAISGRLDFTSQGFHGMLVLTNGDTVYIDPAKQSDSRIYYSLSKRQNASHFHSDFDCQVHRDHALIPDLKESPSLKGQLQGKKLASRPARNTISYRLAVAGTAEFTASQGGSKASAYASIVTTINRVNEIYERDLGVRLQLVSGEQFIYTNAASDPYTNANRSALVDENMVNLDTHLGEDNYDIGHVFAKGALGGLAYVGVACLGTVNTSDGIVHGIKGGGATGIPNPQGELFSIGYVAHELGHQLGATHTYNSTKKSCSGGRTAETAVEPGSGSSIMSYSGICGADNLQSRADAMFHAASIVQINSYTRSQEGATCGTRQVAGNQNATANAGADFKVPLLTPFLLKGSSVAGGSYTWDQLDTGSASAVDVDMGNNALIRTTLPSSKPERFIPRLSDLFAGTKTLGEKLPQTARALNFAFVVRAASDVLIDDKTVTVVDSGGRFKVLSHSNPQTLSTGQSTDISWNVGGTNNAPISCNNVDIKLIRVDGVENILLENTDNDGDEVVTIPAGTPEMTDARIMVACSNHSFFNLSAGAISIQQGAADTTPPMITLNGASRVSLAVGASYTDAGASARDAVDGSVNVVITGSVNTAVAGTYTLTYRASDAAGNQANAVRTVIVTSAADTTAPVIHLTGSSRVNLMQGDNFSDLGASASDNVDAVVSVSTSGSVNTAQPGRYVLTYTATDQAGNRTTATRTVIVTAVSTPPTTPTTPPTTPSPDTTAPVITLAGEASLTLKQGEQFVEPGFSARDNKDGVVSVSVTGAVDNNKVGSYVLTYRASDVAGNAVTKQRTVIIVEKKKDDSGSKSDEKSGGGSLSLLLFPLAIVGLRRRISAKLKSS